MKSETELVTFKGFTDILHRIKSDRIAARSKKKKKTDTRKNNSKGPASYKMGNW